MAFKLRFRSKFWPKHTLDWGIFIVTLLLMPTIYIYEMFIVRPVVWKYAPFFSEVVFYVGLFIFSNIVANFVGLVMTSTHVPQEVMSSTTRPSPKWQYCDTCISYVPPRSWHCKVCRICILKRDHHCLFGGCCVGHYNCRFFIMYLIYVCIGTLYCFISDSKFLIENVDFTSPSALFKIIFPAFAYLSGLESLTNECYILLYIINCAALIFVVVLLRFHIRIVLNGQVTHDVTTNKLDYNYSRAQNIREVMGNRWYIAWAFPLITSPLPSNGIDWETAEEWKMKCQRRSEKSR